ncbi:MAG: hypothetical protein LBQ68_07875, partial [Clostridiales bacterium]|nr:hypothetical protein [Clostridiales bacterium]
MGKDRDQGKRRRRRKKKSAIPIILIILLATLGCIGYVAAYFFLPNFEIVKFHEYFEINPDEVTVVIRDKRMSLEDKPILQNGELYFPIQFVKEYIDPYIFWDSVTQKITITTEDKVTRLMPGENTYYENGEPVSLDVPPYFIDSRAYLPINFLTQIYHITISFNDEENIATMDYLDEPRERGIINSEKARLRYKPDKRAISGLGFIPGEELSIYEVEGEYTRVRTDIGLLGYVYTEYIDIAKPIESVPKPNPKVYSKTPINGKINMVWDQVIAIEDNAEDWRRHTHDGLDVLSPTWFSFDASLDGSIVNIADIDYINWAHEQGYQIWPLLSDFSPNSESILNMDVSNTVLKDTDIREHVIKQLIGYVSLYRLDGINIDFEYIQPDNAENYLQFFRELSPYMNEAGAYLSVDVYNPVLPDYWSRYYNRSELGKVVDYVCVMSYDEHIDSKTGAGAVASLPFVRDGMLQTLDEIPKEKIIMGLPFYTRVWKESGGELTAQAHGMQTAYDMFNGRDAIVSWDEVLGVYYGEYVEDDATYKVWLEELES